MKKLITLLIVVFSFQLIYSQDQCTYCVADDVPTLNLTCTSDNNIDAALSGFTPPGGSFIAGLSISATTAGVYAWKCTDVTGCETSGSWEVIIIDPVISAVDLCSGGNQTVSATGVPAGYSYSWSFGSGASPPTSTTGSTLVSWSTSGSKTITLTVTSGDLSTSCPVQLAIQVGSITGSVTCN